LVILAGVFAGRIRFYLLYPNGFHSLDVFNYLIDQAVQDVDSSRISTGEISDELLIGWGIPVRVIPEDIQQARSGLEPCLGYLFGVFLSLFGKNQTPTHQPGSSAHFSTGI
jgi:hypothetical protein